jgi:hypothetical protein
LDNGPFRPSQIWAIVNKGGAYMNKAENLWNPNGSFTCCISLIEKYSIREIALHGVSDFTSLKMCYIIMNEGKTWGSKFFKVY